MAKARRRVGLVRMVVIAYVVGSTILPWQRHKNSELGQDISDNKTWAVLRTR